MTASQARVRLHTRWGVPKHVEKLYDDLDLPVGVVYAVPSQKAAEEYAAAEISEMGNNAIVELRESLGWCVVVDVTPQMRAYEENT